MNAAADQVTVRVLKGGDSARREVIFRRADGVFAIRVERWGRNEWLGSVIAEGWAVADTPPGFFASAEIAEREALATFSWLRSG
jgi:hypothetical protein